MRCWHLERSSSACARGVAAKATTEKNIAAASANEVVFSVRNLENIGVLSQVGECANCARNRLRIGSLPGGTNPVIAVQLPFSYLCLKAIGHVSSSADR